MHNRLTPFLLALVTALFSATAVSSTLPDAGMDLSYVAGDPSWFEAGAGNDSLAQEPMLLAGKSSKSSESFYCMVKVNKKGKTRYKSVKLTEKKYLKKLAKGVVFISNGPDPIKEQCRNIADIA